MCPGQLFCKADGIGGIGWKLVLNTHEQSHSIKSSDSTDMFMSMNLGRALPNTYQFALENLNYFKSTDLFVSFPLSQQQQQEFFWFKIRF